MTNNQYSLVSQSTDNILSIYDLIIHSITSYNPLSVVCEKRSENMVTQNSWAVVTIETTLQIKGLDATSNFMFFLYFQNYLFCRFSLKASEL